MPYQSNIPLATDKLSKSQADIQGNFIALSTQVNPNNSTFTLAQTVDPASLNNILQMYAKVDANTSGGTGLFLREAIGGIGGPNGDGILPITTSSQIAKGYTYLPSGILIQWGNETTGNPFVFNFPIAFAHTCFSISGTTTRTGDPQGAVVTLSIIDRMTFTAACTKNGAYFAQKFNYIAIGN